MFKNGHDATNSNDNPFWLYSLKQYQEPGCAQFLLQAQDQLNLDVNILLFIGWLSLQHKTLPNRNLLQNAIRWNRTIVRPIRMLRRKMKTAKRAAIYQKIKQLELLAERQQHIILYRVSAHCSNTQLSFESCFTSNIQMYLGRTNKVGKEWLQALMQHLQP